MPSSSSAIGRPRVRGVRRAEVALVAVGLLFLVLQLAWVPRPFGLSTDEATYLAMVDPRVPELYWTPPRAWGTPVLAAPVALFSAGLTTVRTYVAVLTSVLLVAAFRPWIRVLPPAAAPVAALGFGTTWFTVTTGSLVMPNLLVALGAVASTGLFLRAAAEPRWWRTLLTGAAAALVAFVRPTDSVLTVAPVLVVGLLASRLRRLPPLLALLVGVALGWSPWVVEAYLRFGDPLSRLRAGETAGPHGLSPKLSSLETFPRLLDGTPAYCCSSPDPALAGPVPWLYLAWALALVALAVLGVLVAVRWGRLPEVLTVVLSAGLVGAFYLLLPGFLTLRFALPACGLLWLPAAAGLVGVARSGRGPLARTATTLLVVALLAAHLALMLPQAHRQLQLQGDLRSKSVAQAAALRPEVPRHPCVLVATQPQVTAYYLRCRPQVLRPGQTLPARVQQAQASRGSVVALVHGRPARSSYVSSWSRVEVPGLPGGWRAYTPGRRGGA